jgi:hypothetical protein
MNFFFGPLRPFEYRIEIVFTFYRVSVAAGRAARVRFPAGTWRVSGGFHRISLIVNLG